MIKKILFCMALFTLPLAPATAAPVKIVLFGDSLIAGPYIPDNEKVNARLQEQLARNGIEAEVINAGQNGETTAGGLGRMETIMQMKPDVVVLALGANDMLRMQDVQEAYGNLYKILYYLTHDHTTKVMLAGMFALQNLPPEYQAHFNEIYPTLAKQYHIELMPFLLQDVASVPTLNLQDGLHPNSKGAAKIAENMIPYLLRTLGQK